MKTLTILLTIVTFCLVSFGQMSVPVSTTLDVSSISGTDTTLFFQMKKSTSRFITIDWTTFNAWDASIDYGYSSNDSTFTSADGAPFTADSATYAKSVNSLIKVRRSFYQDVYPSRYYAVKVTLNTVSTGTLRIEWE